jgi:hypothetical protein
MRWTIKAFVLFALVSCKPEIQYIPGTGTLPDCDEAPITDLNGTVWFNQGPMTITSTGCLDITPGTVFSSCAENWAFTQTGNDISIIVDEYEVKGRLCGDQLYLEGGWWLSVADEQGGCWYEDDDGDDMRIQAEGNVVTLSPVERTMTGILVLQGQCSVDYDVTFAPVNYPPPPD